MSVIECRFQSSCSDNHGHKWNNSYEVLLDRIDRGRLKYLEESKFHFLSNST
jgi:hypothetical protein